MLKKFIKYIFQVTFLLLVNNWMLAQVESNTNVNNNTIIVSDTVKLDTILPKKERLEDVLTYDSDDQVHEWKKKMSYLLRNAVVDYTDMKITADYIEINWDTGDVYAEGKRDSTGMVTEPTILTQAGKNYEQDAFKVNFKTKVGVAYNVRLTEGEGVVVANRVKRVNDSIMYMRGADYTTDTYFIEKKTTEPDYVLHTSKAKYLDGKNKALIAGPIHMEIYDVPTPLALPFAYIPLGDKRSAGIIIPSFGERTDVGFFLEGGGFYLPIGEYVDVSLTGQLYTKGSWGTNLNSNYYKRYSFRGGLQFNYENRITGIKGLDNYDKNTSFKIDWKHSQDAKANPSLIFSASVGFRSTGKFYRQSINNQNSFNGNVYENGTSSSILLNKTFSDSPFSMSIALLHSQSNNLSSNEPATMLFTLPQFTLNMSRIYPFAPKVGSKKGLLKNLAIGYNMNIENKINTNEDDAFTSKMWENAKNAARHKLGLQTSTTIANYFPVTFNANYDEVWYLKTVNKSYDATEDKVITTDVKGFDAYRTFDVSTGVSTSLYGTYISKKENPLIKGIRHVITPSIGFSFNPNFRSEQWGYYDTYRGADGKKVLYSRFEDGIHGAPNAGLRASINFGISNNLEMKVRSKTDSTGYKKIKIFETLSITSGYNLAAEEFKLSPISISGVTSLLDQKVKINFSGSVDPYKLVFKDEATQGTRIDELGGFRLTRYSINTSYNFDNKTFNKEGFDAKKYKKRGEIRYEEFYFDENDYAQFTIPWKLGLGIVHSYTKGLSREGVTTTNLSINGAISPSPYWSITGRSSYDFQKKKFAGASFTFNRDLRSFKLNFSWVPFGTYKTWSFFIGIKASILSDAVKYDDRSSSNESSSANF